MEDDNELSAGEAAYFESNGEKDIVEPEHEAEIEDDAGEPVAELEADEPEEDEAPVSDKRVKTVPHQALHAERTKRQEVERQNREYLAELQQHREAARQADQKANPPAAPPDAEQDPIAALRHMQEQQQKFVQQRQQEDTQRQQDEQVSRLDTAYRSGWNEFIKATPDAVGAYNHFTSVLNEHFKLRGVADPAQREQLVANEEREIAVAAFQQGKNPADLIYSQAQLYGYAPKEAAPAPDVNKAAEQIERRQKAMPLARSLSAAGGGTTEVALNATSAANMSEEDWMELTPKQQARLLGG
jgi:hypothetical protein